MGKILKKSPKKINAPTEKPNRKLSNRIKKRSEFINPLATYQQTGTDS